MLELVLVFKESELSSLGPMESPRGSTLFSDRNLEESLILLRKASNSCLFKWSVWHMSSCGCCRSIGVGWLLGGGPHTSIRGGGGCRGEALVTVMSTAAVLRFSWLWAAILCAGSTC